MSILIKNVLHQNRRVDVLIKDGRFEKIAPDAEAPADKLIDGSGKAIVPAFYNTHCHAAMSILRGYGDDKPLFAWLREDIWPVEARLTPDDVYVASRLAILEMIKSGTVFFADMYFYGEETMRAVKEMGIRAAVSLVEMDMFDPEQTKSKMAATERFLAADNPCPERIVKGLSCHAVYTVSSELLAFAARTAEENGLTMQIHLSETAGENAECLEKYGVTPTERLDSFGLLTPRTTLAHAVHLNRRDVEIIGERGSFLSHNPVSNLKLNSGLFAFEDLYHRLPGKVTIGTDGASSNNHLSMIESVKFASLAAKCQADSAVAGKAADVFRAATSNGAAAFGLNAGEIREGAPADCLLVDLNNPFMVPAYNLVSDLVYAADSSSIADVICNGRLVMEDRRVEGEAEIVAEARKLAEKIINLK